MTPRRARVTLAAAAAAAAGALSCASPGAPPGGPVDRLAPVIETVTPDSGALNVKDRAVTVRFDEVISERSRGGDLRNVVVLSPSDGAARVQWRRDAITVRPRKGFRENTAYSLTIMPGLSDLSGNPTTKARTYVFSTGASIPDGVVRGAVFDWTTLRPAGGALIDARIGSDTMFRWIARTDSTGRYTLPLLPAGSYTIRAMLDANANGRLEPRELWDSVTVGVADSLRLDLYAFAHDTLGARVVGADVRDSVTLRFSFDRPLALEPVLTADQVEIRRADSSRVSIRAVARAAAYDSLARTRAAAAKDSALRADTSAAGRAARARTDSMAVIAVRDSIERARVEARRAARDTTTTLEFPLPARAMITGDFVAVLDEPLPPGTYRITVRDAVSASRVTRSSERTFTRAKPAEKKGEPEAPPVGDAKAKAPAAPPVKPGTAVPVKPAMTPVKPPTGSISPPEQTAP
ncbi:MAG: Ig-like domain-containing protein [Gemmatimonadaceae bacterium]|nr:Ig-like domain-containing protein [Gemmatimonadaceae bacterium]